MVHNLQGPSVLEVVDPGELHRLHVLCRSYAIGVLARMLRVALLFIQMLDLSCQSASVNKLEVILSVA